MTEPITQGSDPERRRDRVDIDQLDPDRLGRAALSSFFNITRAWGLSAQQERILLGSPPCSTFFNWKKRRQARLSRDTLERISYILGIYKALHTLLPREEAADGWVKRDNAAPPFNGRSARAYMLRGNVCDLADVRRYLDAECG